MNMRKNYRYFGDKPNCSIPFAKDIPLHANDSPVERNNSSCPPSSISSDVPVQSTPADENETSDLHLCEDEETAITTGHPWLYEWQPNARLEWIIQLQIPLFKTPTQGLGFFSKFCQVISTREMKEESSSQDCTTST
ncbi:hypothetical protein NPIL_211691 [Nephila pilipes]|uniref:Uncharacterized protein n=1 Tax=Nephila pilipes TaxID=299642 RepID=A0A8X6MHM6_NEPPI|nr:hypothetical protein NPIL_211691 [Nephila pilipes]